MEGFITHGGTPTGTSTFFEQLNDPLFVAKLTIYNMQTLVGDAFVIYRLYVVYNRNWYIAVLPITLLVGTAITGYGIPTNVVRVGGSDNIFSRQIAPWITSFFALSLTTNVLATILLSGRIMWSNHKVEQYHTGARMSVLETIVQSATLYSTVLICLLATYVSASNGQYVCLNMLQPIIGITFTLIIIRIGLREDTEGEHQRGDKVAVDATGAPPPPLASLQGYGQAYALRPLAVNVSVSRMYGRASFSVYKQKDVGATVINPGSDIEDKLGHRREDPP